MDKEKKKGYLRNRPDFTSVMTYHRFCKIKAMVPLMMEGKDNGEDDWWKVRNFVDNFNKTRSDLLSISKILVLEESMSGFWPR